MWPEVGAGQGLPLLNPFEDSLVLLHVVLDDIRPVGSVAQSFEARQSVQEMGSPKHNTSSLFAYRDV